MLARLCRHLFSECLDIARACFSGQVFADEQARTSGIVRSLEHPRLGTLNLLSSPITISGCQPLMEQPAPDKGQQTEAILRESGFSDEEIQLLRAERIAL